MGQRPFGIQITTVFGAKLAVLIIIIKKKGKKKLMDSDISWWWEGGGDSVSVLSASSNRHSTDILDNNVGFSHKTGKTSHAERLLFENQKVRIPPPPQAPDTHSNHGCE
jgi:hypothetical protein